MLYTQNYTQTRNRSSSVLSEYVLLNVRHILVYLMYIIAIDSNDDCSVPVVVAAVAPAVTVVVSTTNSDDRGIY